MFYPFSRYQVFDYGSASEDPNELVLSNLEADALVFPEFYGDSNGSRMVVFAVRQNWTGTGVSEAGDQVLGAYRASTDFGNLTDLLANHDAITNFVPKGSNIYESSSDDGNGRLALRLHIFYLRGN